MVARCSESGLPSDMAETTTLFICGATGDLTARLLLPALGQLLTLEPDREVRLVGVGRREMSGDDWRTTVRDAFGDDAGPTARSLADATSYLRADITAADGLRTVFDATQGRAVLYFAVPPAVAQTSCQAMRDVEIPDGTILAPEKPFGTDEASAREFNELLTALVPENQVFRVDHFLGQSILLDLFGVRFANRVFEPVWSAEHVESVVIRYDETLGLEGRAGYYDKSGALRDMLQSHLLELLAVVAMDPPASLGKAICVMQPRRRFALPTSGTTTHSPCRGERATPPARSTASDCPPTSTRTASTPPATPRHWPRPPSRSAPTAGRGCLSRCARARRWSRPYARSLSPSAPSVTFPSSSAGRRRPTCCGSGSART